MKLIGSLLLPVGWSICLQREIEKNTLSTRCEPSAQYSSGIRTYVYPYINFEGNSTPLHFMNEVAFNYKSEHEQDRHSLPYSFLAEASFRPSDTELLIIQTNTEKTFVSINGEQPQPVPFDTTKIITLPQNTTTHVKVGYTTLHGESTKLTIETKATPFFNARSLSSIVVSIYKIIFIILIVVFSGFIALDALNTVQMLTDPARHHLTFASALTTIILILKPDTPVLLAMSLLALSFVFLLSPLNDRKKLIPFFLLFLLFTSLSFVSSAISYDEVMILNGGDDPLTHESHARSVITGSSLRKILEAGSTSVFYYQPLYRYIAAITHIILGESLWALFFVQTYLMSMALFASMAFLYMIGKSFATSVFAIGLTYIFTLEYAWPLLALIPYQESLGLPLLILGFLLLLSMVWHGNFQPFYLLGSGLLISAAIMIRTDWMPVVVILLLVSPYIWSKTPMPIRKLNISALFSGLLVFPLFILVRNILIAKTITIFTTSGYVNLLPPLKELFASANEFSFVELSIRLVRIYVSHPSELISLLWLNAHEHFVGQEPLLEYGWLLFIVLGVLTIVQKKKMIRVTTLAIFLLAFLPMLFGSPFLQDNKLAVTSQYTFFLVFGLSFFGALVSSSATSMHRKFIK